MTLEGSEAAEDLLQRAADTLLKFVTLRSHESRQLWSILLQPLQRTAEPEL